MISTTSTCVPTCDATSREQCLDKLDDFINTCQNDITNMLDTLGWTPEHFMQPKSACTCPYDSNHRMTPAALEKHKRVCELVSQGCTREEADKILEDTAYFYENASCVYTVKLEKEVLNSVLWNHHVKNHSVFHGYSKMPLTPEEEAQMLTREDRLGLAEYIVCRAKEANRLKELGRDELQVAENLADLIRKGDEERKLDPVEEMAALRDYRRRRQTYRAKNVHITKKSHTEIMREVITNQMDMYAKSLADEEAISQAMLHDRIPVIAEQREEEYEEGECRQTDRETGKDREKSRYRDLGERGMRERDRRHSPSRSRDSEKERDRSRRIDREQSDSRSRDLERDRERRSASRTQNSERESDKPRHKRKDRHKSRSRSKSSESYREKKSKRKSKKHKKHKHRRKSSEREDTSRQSSETADKSRHHSLEREDKNATIPQSQIVADQEQTEEKDSRLMS